ncbi:MAG TPA: class I SAM-dependent methyltransferase [Alphaproteobacteria bacterium]|nr:class I SAM-dependent methyltransferase [Alphaproteobacteria bacterium]
MELVVEFLLSLLGLFLIVAVALNEIYQQKMKVSAMPTAASTRHAMIDTIAQKDPETIVELGSGWGGIAIEAARKYPKCEVIGFECSPIPLLAARLRKLFNPRLKNLRFLRRDFFKFDMKDADVVLCYLSNPHMAQLEPKLDNELQEGAEIISSTFHMPHWKTRSVNTIGGMYDTKIYAYQKTAQALGA